MEEQQFNALETREQVIEALNKIRSEAAIANETFQIAVEFSSSDAAALGEAYNECERLRLLTEALEEYLEQSEDKEERRPQPVLRAQNSDEFEEQMKLATANSLLPSNAQAKGDEEFARLLAECRSDEEIHELEHAFSRMATEKSSSSSSSTSSGGCVGGGGGGGGEGGSERRKKSSRPCYYFNSRNGCRNGEHCFFSHTKSEQKSTSTARAAAIASATPSSSSGSKKEGGSVKATVASAGGEGDDERTCCVCMTLPKSVLYLPCKHVCVCKACSELPGSNTCPLCRVAIETKMVIFL